MPASHPSSRWLRKEPFAKEPTRRFLKYGWPTGLAFSVHDARYNQAGVVIEGPRVMSRWVEPGCLPQGLPDMHVSAKTQSLFIWNLIWPTETD